MPILSSDSSESSQAQSGLKKCAGCQTTKSTGEFGSDVSYKDKLDHYCKECRKDRRAKNIGATRAYNKKYYLDHAAVLRPKHREYGRTHRVSQWKPEHDIEISTPS